MNIIIQYDSSVANAPAGYKVAVQAAVNFIDHLFTNNISITVVFGYGKLNGNPMPAGALGESNTNGYFQTYSQYVSNLTAVATSTAQKQSLAALPSASTLGAIPKSSPNPVNTDGMFWVSDTQAKAFGITNDPHYQDPEDGFASLASRYNMTFDPNNRAVSGAYDAIGVLEHEITEAMGRISYMDTQLTSNSLTYSTWGAVDLFRYSSAGVHQWTETDSTTLGYFSTDGQHMLLPYNNPNANTGDSGDWDTNSIGGDAFGAGAQGVESQLSATDILEMNDLGFQVATPRSTDFHNDGLSNLLIQNTNGSVLAGEVSGSAVSWNQLGGLGKEWTFIANGDFLGDGLSNYMVESTSGAVVVGEVGPDITAAYTQVATLGKEWTIEGAGNLLGNGKYDMLMWNTNGAVVIGEADPLTSRMAFSTVGGLGHEWSFRGVGDYLGEGHAQFLIQNTSGAVYVGDDVGGTEQYKSLGGLGPEWTFVESGDFLGDSKTDFLLKNTNGALVVGEVGASNIVTYTTLSGGLGPEWKFVGAGDYLGLGHAQFLIESTNGAVYAGAVSGTSVQYTSVAGLGAEWTFHS